jgi:nucleoside-diphosphate kinase
MSRNVCHGSDAVLSAKTEVDLWFREDELIDYERADSQWLYQGS